MLWQIINNDGEMFAIKIMITLTLLTQNDINIQFSPHICSLKSTILALGMQLLE